jgi:acetoacetate decarboxylase
VTSRTHHSAVEQLLPDGFRVGVEPDREPLVTVSYSRNRGIDWLAGGSYNIVGVNVAATFEGEVDKLAGGYCVIMWEDRTEPILTGREQTGIPKVYADITDFLPLENGVLARASQLGHPIVEVEVRDLEPLPEEGVREFEKSFESNPTQFQVVNLLCELEPLEIKSAFRTQSRSRLLGGQARALR